MQRVLISIPFHLLAVSMARPLVRKNSWKVSYQQSGAFHQTLFKYFALRSIRNAEA
jgi:hypothetical protein